MNSLRRLSKILLLLALTSLLFPAYASELPRPDGALPDPELSRPAHTECDFSGYWGWTNFFTNSICTIRVLTAAIVWPFLMLAGGILTIATVLFNVSIDAGIIRFGTWYEPIRTGVESGWTLMRDFANIGIIGIFTYVAISMIIGNTTFGTKRMVARVLIAATLINFSLLFTKVILDVSHFVAREVYVVVDRQYAPATSSLSGTVTWTTTGIGNALMQFARMSSAYDSWNAVREHQEHARDFGILFGVLSVVFFLAAAILLFYGSALILARMIMLLVLLLTSSLAFATWLLPGLKESAYGWNGWWKSLLNNAIFAPLLMIMLLITLNIAQALDAGWQTMGQRGTLGALATSPVQNIGALLQLIIVLGLFYGTLRIANALSAQWAVSIANRLTGNAGMTPAARLIGRTGRFAIGRPALGVKNALNARAKKHFRDGNFLRSAAYNKLANVFGRAAKRDFNPANTKLGAGFAKQFGVDQKTLAGTTVGGIEGALKKKAEAFGQKAAELAKDRTQTEKEAITRAQPEVIDAHHDAESAEERRRNAEIARDGARQAREEAARAHAQAVDALKQQQRAADAKREEQRTLTQREAEEKSTAAERHDIELEGVAQHIQAIRKRITDEGRAASASETQQLNALSDQVAVLTKQKEVAEAQITERFTRRREQIKTDLAELDQAVAAKQDAVKAAERTALARDENLSRAESALQEASRASRDADRKAQKTFNDTLQKVSNGVYDVNRLAPKTWSLNRDSLAKAARESIVGKAGEKKLREVLKDFAAGESPTKPPAAP